MRITGGEFAGRRIHCPPGTIRPAMDRMREAVFSSLGPLNGLTFLDLFSGSGIIALEAASRGASRVHSVERDRRKKDMLKENLGIAGDHCSFTLGAVERFIMTRQERFDIIFLDPPFPYKHKNDLLKKLINSALVGPETRVLMHFPAEDRIRSEFQDTDGQKSLVFEKEKKFGRSRVYYFRVMRPQAQQEVP
ncbi:RsmD family RNA methyltransferase [Salinispira pacifica]|uniref:16S ribosomal RNA (Guanine(966)-N(2))-methyltransferase n=1 Tax=Salinispira pacifica TaxID=1307761 RepID=V5WFW4_9SPIO|nr:RsmD family RNA methyltransferase [Salinispira pacifica]AHC14459.1 16S ribosomal RNA (guanine(966)-N(2))-methyltransferase [Salinispira pacifica]